MLQTFIDDMKSGMRAAARTSGVVAAAALTAFVTLCFLCAAVFVFVLETYGLIIACLAGAGVFFVVTLLLLIYLDELRRRAARRPKEVAKSVVQVAATDPMVIAAGLQLVRTIGIKRLIPLVALGGVALGLLARPPKPPGNSNKG